jgi:hypothetical protein
MPPLPADQLWQRLAMPKRQQVFLLLGEMLSRQLLPAAAQEVTHEQH